MKSLDLLTASGAKDRNILLAGDFNCPDVDWNTNTVPGGGRKGGGGGGGVRLLCSFEKKLGGGGRRRMENL